MSSDDRDSVAQAQASWRTALAQLPADTDWVDAMVERQRELGLLYAGRPAMLVAEPAFITQDQMAEDRGAIAAVLASLKAAADAVIADQRLRDVYAAHWWASMPHADLLSVGAGYSQPFVFGRLDALRTAEGLRFLEFNGGLPGGVHPADLAPAILDETALAAGFAQAHPYQLAAPGPRVIAALVSTWHEFGGSGLPFVVVALPNELRDLAARAVDHLRGVAQSAGVEVVVTDPGELAFAGGRLRWQGRAVDVVVRAFFTPMFAYLGERLDGLLTALRAEAVCMVTSLQSGLYGLKSLFAVITDPRIELDVPAAPRELARQALPWTRLLAPGTTLDPEGREVEVRDYVLAQRAHLVVKPMEGYGGSGVELGWLHSAESWEAAVDRAMAGGHIVQQRVRAVTQEFARLAPGFPTDSFIADQNPLICSGELAGYFVRLAPAGSGLTNLTSGDGTVAGVFVLD